MLSNDLKLPQEPKPSKFLYYEGLIDDARKEEKRYRVAVAKRDSLSNRVSFVVSVVLLIVFHVVLYPEWGYDFGGFCVLSFVFVLMVVPFIYLICHALIDRLRKIEPPKVSSNDAIERRRNYLNAFNDYRVQMSKYPDVENYNYNIKDYKEYLLGLMSGKLKSTCEWHCRLADRTKWKEMDWFEFEKSVAAWFSLQGYDTRLTKYGADGGVDIVLHKDGEESLVQCKHYKNRIDVKIARELAGVMLISNVKKGFIVCLDGGATAEAKETMDKANIKLITLEELVSIMPVKFRTFENDYYIQIGDMYMKKVVFLTRDSASEYTIKGGFDVFYGKVRFKAHIETTPVQLDLFENNVLYSTLGIYGVTRIDERYPFYVVVLSTRPQLEDLGAEILIERETKKKEIRYVPKPKVETKKKNTKRRSYRKWYW